MNPAEQKAFYDANGYLVVPEIISPPELERLRAMVDQVLEGSIAPELPEPDTGRPAADFHIQWEPALRDNETVERREKVRIVFHLCHTHPYFRYHATRPEIMTVVENLLGPDVKLYTDQMFVKPPHHGSEVPFHQDSGYWPAVRPHNMLSCWMALDDATIENGCVHYIPGTHRELIPHHQFEGVQPWGLLPEQLEVDKEIPVEIKAGSAVLHHSLVVHRSFANNSDRGRRGLVSIYMPANLEFVQPWPFPYGFHTARALQAA